MSYILDALKKSEGERQRRVEQDNTIDGIRPPRPAKYAVNKRLPVIASIVILLLISIVAVVFIDNEKYKTGSGEILEQAIVYKTPAKIASSNPATVNDNLQEKTSGQTSEELKTFKTLPFFWEKPAAYRQGIDPFSVSIHVYASNPSQRILFINNREYRAGEQTQQGPKVESIEPQGVILSYRGEYFKLPRPR